jgi:hypothetical protein
MLIYASWRVHTLKYHLHSINFAIVDVYSHVIFKFSLDFCHNKMFEFVQALANPSSCTVALGSTQPLTEMSTRNLPGGKGWLARKVDNRTAICELIVEKMWEPQCLTTLWALMACYRDSFTFSLELEFL